MTKSLAIIMGFARAPLFVGFRVPFINFNVLQLMRHLRSGAPNGRSTK